jgi:hypothetical protein
MALLTLDLNALKNSGKPGTLHLEKRGTNRARGI